ncbi:GntR family transcriptional regulator [Nonomuraea sp. NPDC046802]|uniref:GntR family transcriptional regulator n=1 Tax=Nonomuraea sp. NPDC046802 TaxID=3154919 RepID=UPI00340936F3
MAKPPAKAQKIAWELAQRIHAGEFPPGSWFLSERQLAKEYDISRGTSRRVLGMLADEGVIIRTPDGSQVCSPALSVAELLKAGHSVTLTQTAEGRVKADAFDAGGCVTATGEGPTPEQAMSGMRYLSPPQTGHAGFEQAPPPSPTS